MGALADARRLSGDRGRQRIARRQRRCRAIARRDRRRRAAPRIRCRLSCGLAPRDIGRRVLHGRRCVARSASSCRRSSIPVTAGAADIVLGRRVAESSPCVAAARACLRMRCWRARSGRAPAGHCATSVRCAQPDVSRCLRSVSSIAGSATRSRWCCGRPLPGGECRRSMSATGNGSGSRRSPAAIRGTARAVRDMREVFAA